MNKISRIVLNNSSFKLSDDLIEKTQFIRARHFTLSKNPIATHGIGPCVAIGISCGGINYLEHATPNDFDKKNGESIKRMEEVIKQFIKHDCIPYIYLFVSTVSMNDLENIFTILNKFGLIKKNKVILCDCIYFFQHMSEGNFYYGIYDNKVFFFDKKIENKNLKYNASNLKINKKNLEIKELKIGDFVKIKGNSDNIYIIFNYDIASAKYVLFNLSSRYNEEELQKKNQYSMLPFITDRNKNQLNISNELPVQPIPKYVQNFISEHNNSLPFFNARNYISNDNNNNLPFFNAKNKFE